jgi:NhaA family Na+:H+ antiporter
VPVELRVFLTAAVIADDLAAIVVVALFYTSAIHVAWLVASVALTASLVFLNRAKVYRAMPYAVLGVALWFALHEAGLHATLAGVILAAVTPTRPPGNLTALMAQAQAIIDAETRQGGEAVMRHGPSEAGLRQLDTLHDRIDSPANKLHRAIEPWSSYFVLPLFALANAGVVWSTEVLVGRERLMLATIAALVMGKPAGILLGAFAAVRVGVASKPAAYSWRHVAGAGALAGIGFTMSLFIAGAALDGADYDATKLAIFAASILAGLLGAMILWRRVLPEVAHPDGTDRHLQVAEQGTPVESSDSTPATVT